MALGNNIQEGTPKDALGTVKAEDQNNATLAVGEDEEYTELGGSRASMHIIFRVEEEEFALPISLVKEVIPSPIIAPVPQTSNYILGIANVRGNVVTVFDMAVRLGLKDVSDTEDTSNEFLMVINSDDFGVALKVKNVPDTVSIDASEIEKPSNMVFQSGGDTNLFKGLVKRNGRMIVVFDAIGMIKNEELDLQAQK